MTEKIEINKIGEYIYEIPKDEEMAVPGRVYGDEDIVRHLRKDIEQGKDWNALKQIRNVACLPGIQRYSLAMADIHPGYGYPIGGIGAFDLETGVISVAGVGFDINCLTPGSKVLTSHGYFRHIEDLELDFSLEDNHSGSYVLKSAIGKTSVVSLQHSKSDFTQKAIAYFMKRKHAGKVLAISTKLGYSVKVTEEHPVLTQDGMRESRFLFKGQQIAIHPFEGVRFDAPEHEMQIVDEEVFSELERNELVKRDLLPLKLTNPKIAILARLYGFLLGDGCIYFSGRKGYVHAYGSVEDLEEIKKDFSELGFSARIYSRNREHRIPTRYGVVEFSSANHELHVSSRSLAKLFAELGYPLGDKTNSHYVVPKWIMDGPLWIKRLFLAGLFGAELSKPRTHTKTGFDCPTLSMNKNRPLAENAREFAIQVMVLLDQFGIESHKLLHRKDYFNRHGPTDRIKLQISSQEDNLLKLWSNIGFCYNKKRSQLAQIAILYIKEKAFLTQKRADAAVKIRDLKSRGLTLKEVQGLIESPITNSRFVERHYYEDAGFRISLDFPSFKDYTAFKTEEMKKYGCLFDTIVSIQKEDYEGWVYDVNVPDTHNFIANGIIVSNCGVRTLKTRITRADVEKIKKELADALFKTVPAGIGSKGDLALEEKELDELLVRGAEFVVEKGYGNHDDLKYIEEEGCVKGADPSNVSKRSKQREYRQIGTLGSGNHYLEVQYVEEVFDEEAAKAYGLFKDQVLVSIHCGSRALGHQIGTDYLKDLEEASKKYGIPIRDKELVCAPIRSPEGERYFSAVNAGINCAFANRQAIAHLTRKAFSGLGVNSEEIETLYDIGHNNVKIERHTVDGKAMDLMVHRKGSTRAFGPGRDEVPVAYRKIGQPVLVGGTMGTASYILHGTELGMRDTFGSAVHGAGRIMSRNQAMSQWKGPRLIDELAKKGIIIKGHSLAGIAEEAPGAYKEVEQVVDVMHNSGVAKKVVRVRPMISIKG